jgi:hypothetical protein
MPDTGLSGIYDCLKRLNMELWRWKIKAADSGNETREDDIRSEITVAFLFLH